MRNPVEIIYDKTHGRWVVDLGGRSYGLHCGECFELIIGSLQVPCRLELDSEWYVIIRDRRFNLRPRDAYMIRL